MGADFSDFCPHRRPCELVPALRVFPHMNLVSDRDRVAHLLRRFGLGASQAEVDFYTQNGWKGAIDALLNYEQTDEGFDCSVARFKALNGRLPIFGVQAWWVLRLLTTKRPLQEKMTVFWHNHFATGADKVTQGPFMYQQNETLRANATGKFHDLLLQVSQDPAMLLYLDNQYNVKGKANENFAREVMELFTLGIGHYTEKDIQESARAFTGWSLRRLRPAENEEALNGTRAAVFMFRPRLHDDGEKTFLGQTGNLDGEDIIGILCDNPQTARFIAKKMWTWFAYPNPEPAVLERVAGRFRDSGLDIKVLIRSIMESDEFYSDKAFRRVFKNPLDFAIAPMRQLGVGSQLAAAVKGIGPIGGPERNVIGTAQAAMKAMGMPLFFPPNVAGWDGGAAWVTTATMIERVAYAQALYGQVPAGARRPQIRYNVFPMLQGTASLDDAAKRLADVYDAPLTMAEMRTVTHRAMEATQGQLTEQNANAMASEASRLIFGAPDYQFC